MLLLEHRGGWRTHLLSTGTSSEVVCCTSPKGRLTMWHKGFEVGIVDVDRQHRELFERLEALVEAGTRGDGKESLAAMLDFLQQYVVHHFETEEALMKGGDYPGFAAHRAEHVAFIRRLEEFQQDLSAQGATINLTLAVNQLLIDWLAGHILQSDRAMGAFLTGCAAGQG